MKTSVLRLVLCLLVLILGVGQGVCRERGEEFAVRDVAVMQAATETGGRKDGHTKEQTISQQKDAALVGAENTVTPPSGGNSERNSKRQQKRWYNQYFSDAPAESQGRIGLSKRLASKGFSRHPLTQDAQQERTKTLRFLHFAADID